MVSVDLEVVPVSDSLVVVSVDLEVVPVSVSLVVVSVDLEVVPVSVSLVVVSVDLEVVPVSDSLVVVSVVTDGVVVDSVVVDSVVPDGVVSVRVVSVGTVVVSVVASLSTVIEPSFVVITTLPPVSLLASISLNVTGYLPSSSGTVNRRYRTGSSPAIWLEPSASAHTTVISFWLMVAVPV